MLHMIETINAAVNNFIWGVPAMICIFGVGLFLSVRTNFLQIRKFPYAIRTTIGRMFRKRNASEDVYKRQDIAPFVVKLQVVYCFFIGMPVETFREFVCI